MASSTTYPRCGSTAGLEATQVLGACTRHFHSSSASGLRGIDAADGTLVSLLITGASGGEWALLREEQIWRLYQDVLQKPDAQVIVEEDVAWRMFTKGFSQEDARTRVIVLGDHSLGLKVLDMVSIIA